jgi:hypothetical protein
MAYNEVVIRDVSKYKASDEEKKCLYETLAKLTKQTDINGNYLAAQISFGDNCRSFVCLCPTLRAGYVVHTEYDLHPYLSGTEVISKKFVVDDYIDTIAVSANNNITYIGIHEDVDNRDVISEVYKK